uniref:Putative transcription regulator n=1 Tax=Streptoalloteichus tenebrarius (strain ATCC 17920 / DSM 40477 / JCM 4838 / CBS 697.72 / NBRC 16177 / NCIMB 11028 / NRRL B-12390 / A12253. 1 / ISP 5477) TaxID=1933 RepID=Q2MF36_STRSD|nr:putative transcription regulator [Streptoalloteichus tenebrarius]
MQAAIGAGTDPTSAEGRELAREWMGSLEQFHGGEPGLWDSLYQDVRGERRADRGELWWVDSGADGVHQAGQRRELLIRSAKRRVEHRSGR